MNKDRLRGHEWSKYDMDRINDEDEIVIESDGTCKGMPILAGKSLDARIHFGDESNTQTGKIWRSKDWARMLMLGSVTIKVKNIRRSRI